MKKNITVLGATGTIGRKIAQILVDEGHRVTLVARYTEKLKDLVEKGAVVINGDLMDTKTIARAFVNADSAFTLLPDNVMAEDTRAYQRAVTGSLIEAIQESGITHIVNMSSVGSHMHEGNGMMGGTAEQEVRFNQLKGVHVVHIRSAYFMENFLRTMGLVKKMNINGTAANGDHPIPMVATIDVAVLAARYLADADFEGKKVHAVMGPRNYTMREVTTIIGKAINKPELPYVQFPLEQAKTTFLNNGFAPDFVDNLLGMATAIETGFMNYQKRDESTTTTTTAEAFANNIYAPAYNAIP